MNSSRLSQILQVLLIILINTASYGQNPIKETRLTRKLGNIEIIITQFKSLIKYPKIPLCNAEISIKKNGNKIDSIIFKEIEGVGGDYGLNVYNELINDHLIITKYGDYDGLTIIINNKGEVFSIIGGYIFVDFESNILFSIYDSDLSGFSVFDLSSDSEILKTTEMEDRPNAFYKQKSEYLMKTINDETETEAIWNVNLLTKELNKVQIELETLNDFLLNKLIEKNKINCE